MMLERLLKAVPRICSTDSQLLMLEQYETLFKIYDHTRTDPLHPFAAVEMHPAEDNLTNSLLYERYEQFMFHKVHQYSGLNWEQFKQLPCYEAAETLRLASIQRERDEREAGSLAAQLGKGLK